MKSLKRRFEKVKKENPSLSSFMCFSQAVNGQNFSQRIIRLWLHDLVEVNDYEKKDERGILNYLYSL